MDMALLHRRSAYHDEASLGAQLLDIPCSTVTHAGSQAADQLINERRQVALVGHAALDAFGHELAGVVAALPIAFARPGDHRPDRAHAAIRLEAAALVNDELPGAFRQPRQQTAEHHRMSTSRQRLDQIARVADAAVGDQPERRFP